MRKRRRPRRRAIGGAGVASIGGGMIGDQPLRCGGWAAPCAARRRATRHRWNHRTAESTGCHRRL
jgi:hypothetical protein